MEPAPRFLREYAAATEAVAMFDLRGHGIIELTGRDAAIFLHNLCTQNVKNLPVGRSVEAFLTTNKARVIAHVWVTRRADNLLWLDMVAGQADKVLTHLNHYLISEQVELTDRSQEFAVLRLIGPKVAVWLSAVLEQPFATMASFETRSLARSGVIRRQNLLALDGFDLVCPATEMPALRDRLVIAGAVPAGTETYQSLRIEAGLPEYGIDIDENRLAMEVNRTAQAISYTKGCYLGQETIVMARDRGQVNRLLTGVLVPALLPGEELGVKGIPSGTKLFRDNIEVGEITSSVFSPKRQQPIALAYLRRGHWDAGTEMVIDPKADGRTAVASALPFGAAG
jgi:tRNA-modifying protein YgfZ